MNLIKISERIIKVFDSDLKAEIALRAIRKSSSKIQSDKKYMYGRVGRKLYGSVWEKIEPDANPETDIGIGG